MSLTLRDLRRIAVIAAAYYVAARLGLLAAVAQPVISSAWPPAGIALAALLLYGVRAWPGVALGAFLLNVTSGVPVSWAALMGLGNTAEAVIGVLLLNRAGFERDLVRLADVLALLLFGALVAPVVAASIGVASLNGAGQIAAGAGPRLWLVYWSGDALGIMLFAPLVLAWGGGGRPAASRRRTVEAGILAVVLVGFTALLFRSPLGYNYVVFPIVCWAAIRFGVRGASSASAAVAVLTVWFTIQGVGPFANANRSPTANLSLLQTYVAIVSATGLALAAAVSERLRTADKLQASEQRFRLFLESVRDYAIVMLDPEGRVTTWNSGAERVCGWTAEEIVGQPMATFYTEDDRALERPAANLRIAARFGWVEEEGWRLRKDGARYWADVTIASVRDASGALLGFAKITRDLTERRRTEEALKDREQLLETMFDRTASGIALLDRAGRFVRVNQRFERLLGYTARELTGEPLDGLLDPADGAQSREALADVLSSRRESVQSEARMRRRDGESLWVLSTMAVMPGPDGTPRNFITIVEDISAQRRAQEELHTNREELRALSQQLLDVQETERTRLARELHDQIGQALSAVLMSLENLSRPVPAERRSPTPIQESKQVVERAIEQVRTLSFDLRPAMLDDLGLASAAAAYCRRQAKLAGLELRLEIAPLAGSPPKHVEVACYRILQEAVTNTLRHAEARRLGLRLCGDSRTLELVVEDDGRGFDLKRLRHAGPGRQLGLVGMRERAEQAGGTVAVSARPGKGTQVRAQFHFEEEAT